MVPATRELVEALDIARTRRICLEVANARPGTGTIVFLRIARGQNYLVLRIYVCHPGQGNSGDTACIMINK